MFPPNKKHLEGGCCYAEKLLLFSNYLRFAVIVTLNMLTDNDVFDQLLKTG